MELLSYINNILRFKKVKNKMYSNIISLSIFITVSLSTLNAMSFSSIDNGYYNFIYASGKIRKGDTYKLSRAYKKLPHNKQTIVIFNSGGGEMSTGIQIGNYLKQHHIGSAVAKRGMCASSCALAFLGGRDLSGNKLMVLPYGSKLGYHSFYYRNQRYVSSDKVQKDLSYLMKYFSYVNAPSDLVTKMLSTPSGSMYWITSSNNRYLNLQRGLKNVSFENKDQSRYTYKTNDSSESKIAYIKSYFDKVNMVIKANRGYQSSYTTALNANSYNNWLANNLRYAYITKMHLYGNNIIKVKANYMLSNGQRACTNNTYKLRQTNDNNWRVVYKRIVPCSKHSSRVIRRIKNELP